MPNAEVKWFTSDNLNAPQLTNTWGCIIDVLDACLITGFGFQVVSSIVITNGVGVATFGTSHNIKQFQVVEFSGAQNDVLNKEFKVLGLTANTLEFLVDLPDQTVTGSITCKLASAGWGKKFSGTHKAVYQAKNLTANPYFLRVDNSLDPVYTTTYAKFAKVGILESCTGINDISGNQVPYNVLNPNKNWIGTGSGISAINGWAKWYCAIGATAATDQIGETTVPTLTKGEWTIIVDDSSFYIISTPVDYLTSNRHIATYMYGFGVSEKKNFRVPFLLAHQRNVAVSSAEFFFNSNPLRYGWAPSIITMTTNTGVYSQDLQAYPQYYLPNKTTDMVQMRSGALLFTSLEPGIHFSKIMLHSSTNALLGAMPLAYSMQSPHDLIADLHTFTEDGECFLLKKVAQANVIGAFIFKVGEL